MVDFLYIYDCRQARQTNARRVSFTKELHGYIYSWKTRTGIKSRKKPGLIDQCEGAMCVADSAVIVPGICRNLFDDLFRRFDDILEVRIYEILQEVTYL